MLTKTPEHISFSLREAWLSDLERWGRFHQWKKHPLSRDTNLTYLRCPYLDAPLQRYGRCRRSCAVCCSGASSPGSCGCPLWTPASPPLACRWRDPPARPVSSAACQTPRSLPCPFATRCGRPNWPHNEKEDMWLPGATRESHTHYLETNINVYHNWGFQLCKFKAIT